MSDSTALAAVAVSVAMSFASIACGGTLSATEGDAGDASTERPPSRDAAPDSPAARDAGASSDAGDASEIDVVPVTLASDRCIPFDLAVDSLNVYWTDSSGGAVLSVPIVGGAVSTVATAQNTPWGIALDGAGNVYWADSASPAGVMEAATTGGSATVLATSNSSPWGVAVDATSVYWANAGSCAADGGCMGSVVKVGREAGAATTLATAAGPSAVAVDSTSVYYTDYLGNSIVKLPLAGGTPTTLAAGLGNPFALAVDATSVYWVDSGDGKLMKVGIAGGTPVSLAQGVASQGIAIDSLNIYWTDWGAGLGGGVVRATPKAGGASITLASGQDTPRGIAVDATTVYWANGPAAACSGAILKLPKP
jgi:hypothetical protein